MRRRIGWLLMVMVLCTGLLAVAPRASAAPAPRGHCQYGYPLSYIQCVSAGFRWITPRR
jgi:hypothetical protein